MTGIAGGAPRTDAGCLNHGPPPPPDKVEEEARPPADAREIRAAAESTGPAKARLTAISTSGANGVVLPLAPGQIAVAPSDVGEANTIRETLRAIACWTASTAHFGFDSSFILPEMADEIPRLAAVVKANPGAPGTIFAHADPVGNDGYNKQLSGRRALALFGLLTRRTDLWERLFTNPFGGDNWQTTAPAIMAGHLAGLQTGGAVPAGRPALFQAYMDAISRDASGKDFRLTKDDFLARGADAGGKGDIQGCSEFNPVLMLSQSETARLERRENRAERDIAQEPNRRVLMLFFKPGSVVKPDKWPCPRATEGVTACQKRFFADAAARRRPQEKNREHPADRSTFACRFYDRLVGDSPCEVVSRPVTVRLYDPKGRPMGKAPFRLFDQDQLLMEGVADSGGFFRVRNFPSPTGFLIEWGPAVAPGKKPEFPFGDVLHLNLSADRNTRVTQQLANLGYSGQAALETKVKAFQRDFRNRFGLEPTGTLDPATVAAIDDAHSRVGVDDLKGRGT